MARSAMVSLMLLLSLTSATIHVGQAKTWGLFIASAKGWYNYGMQSDALHAYQIMKEGGIPDEQLIVMLYDDLAEFEGNPFKGQLFASYDLVDVYQGAPKDYTGKEVTKDVFQAVLRGDKQAVKTLLGRDGRVVETGPDDNIFLFLEDHGSPGFIAWWDRNYLTAKEFNETISGMHENTRYSNLVIYIDICHAGSIFENILPNNIGVYVATASNVTGPAYGVECHSEYFKDDPTCIGGLFTINWAYEAQSADRSAQTLDQQFRQTVIASEGWSVPKQYGDLSIAQKFQSEFFGNAAHNPNKPSRSRRSRRSAGVGSAPMPKHMMVYYHLKNKLATLSANSAEYNEVNEELDRVETLMGQADQLMREIPLRVYGRFQAARATREHGIINWSCYEPVLEAVRAECPGMTSREEVKYYAMSQFGVLINLCNDAPTSQVLAAVRDSARASPLCKLD